MRKQKEPIKTFFLLLTTVSEFLSTDGGQDLPAFLSAPQQYKVRQGEHLHLPCQTSATGSAVITWTWNGRLLSAGSMKVYDDDRIEVVNDGRELIVREVTREDKGEYSCTVNLKLEPVSLSHTVQILVKPTVSIISKEKILKVEEGSKVEIGCSAEGYPKPEVHWEVKTKPGQVLSKESTLVLRQVTPEQAGEYLCVATNNQGTSDDGIKINVLYKPRTKLSRKSSPRHSFSTMSVLSCKVDSNPAAKVLWYKDGLIISQAIISIKKEGKFEVHSLTIPSMSESDYGNYSCLAKNILGTTTDYLFFSGSPDQPDIISNNQGLYTNTYNLEWRVFSPKSFPVLNQSILYRRIKQGMTTSLDGGDPGSWYNLALISENEDGTDSYSMVLTGLDKGAQYEVRLRAMNRQGWSPLSESFIFSTADSSFHPNSFSSLSGRQLASSSPSNTQFSVFSFTLVFLAASLRRF